MSLGRETGKAYSAIIIHIKINSKNEELLLYYDCTFFLQHLIVLNRSTIA